MIVPAQLVEIVKAFEGLRLKAYLCPAGIPTIGYGHTRGVSLGQEISKTQADSYLVQDASYAVVGAIRQCPTLANAPAAHLAAIADFVFNLGEGRLKASTLRRRINYGEWDLVPGELSRWVYANGKKLAGLVARRETEICLIRTSGQ